MEDRKLWFVTNAENESLTMNEEELPYCDAAREATPDEITLDSLADMLDQSAESENHHDFVGVHRRLGKLVMARHGEETATRVLRDLVNFGGLHCLNAHFIPGLDDIDRF